MSEQTTTPTIAELTTEIETLRRVNTDLLTKKAKNKDKVATLEAQNIELQTRLDASEGRIKQVAIDRPMQRLLRDVSVVPDVLLDRLTKSGYRFESSDDGELILVNADGSPVLADKDGNATPLEKQNLIDFLTKDHQEAAVYRHLLVGSGASGGGARGSGRDSGLSSFAVPPSEKQQPARISFGLK